MTDDMIPTPYGVLVDVVTGEPIGPATVEQHAARSIPGAPLLTLEDGRQADVIGGPALKDCGHSDEDHEEAWQAAKRFVASVLPYILDIPPDAGLIDLPAAYVDGLGVPFNKVCLVATAGSLAFRAGLKGSDVERACREKNSPFAGMALHHVMTVARGVTGVSDKVFDLIGIMDDDEMTTVLELGASAAYNIGMSSEDVRAFVMDGSRPDHHG